MTNLNKIITLALIAASGASAGEWSAPVNVLHEFRPIVTYKAKIDGEFLVVQATIQPGWHTFAIDNERRAAEKLAGKPSLGIDQPTNFKLSNGLEAMGVWYQTPPLDFSKPELRWFSWGFEQQAVFATKIRRSGAGPAEIGIRGQACSDKTCKNIDLSLSVPVPPSTGGAASPDLKSLVPVR